MPRKNHGPTRISLKNLLEPLQHEANKTGVPLHYLCKKILREHVRISHPEVLIKEPVIKKEDAYVHIRLDELKAPLREDASDMEKPLQWLVFRVLKNYVESLKNEQCSKQ